MCTLDDISALTAELEADRNYSVSPPGRLSSGVLDRQVDGQLELLSITIGFATSLAATVAYDQVKSLVVFLRERGNRSLNIEDEPGESTDDDNPE
jgi:hypothetical protein